MKRIKIILFYILLFLGTTALYAQTTTPPKREMRSAWLTTAWGIDWPSQYDNATTQQTKLKNIIKKLHDNNFNAVCFQVRSFSDAMYKSSYEPWSYILTGNRGDDPGYDPLQVAVEYAHSLGMELHAWVNPYRYSSAKGTYSAKLSKDYAKTHPEWLMHSKDDEYITILNPGIPEVREQIVKVIAEIVTNYDIDGVLFDDYFYLNPSDQKQGHGIKESEDDTYYAKYNPNKLSRADWRRDQVNQMVQMVYNKIQEIKPACRFGIGPAGVAATDATVAAKYGVERCTAPAGDWQYDQIYSDPLAWLQAGTIDYISPQIYWPRSHETASYDLLSNWWSKVANQFNRHFFASHTLSALDSTGGGVDGKLSNQEFVEQIKLNRNYTQNAAPGSIFYSLTNGTSSSTFLNHIKTNSFSANALPPAVGWKAADNLTAPTGLKLSGSTLSWNTHSSATRFTVYAYTKGLNSTDAMADPSNLVGVVYGTSISLSNVTDYASKTLAVCAYDRYGNEHLAAFLNKQSANPSITSTITQISLTGEQYSTPAPYVDVTIKASDLSGPMTYNSTTGSVKVTTISWSPYTGGILRVMLNTDFAPDDYSGYLSLQQGSTTLKILISVSITPPTPVLTVSTNRIHLSGVQGDAAPYKDVTITGKYLTSDMTITATLGTGLSYETLAGWNNTEGGTLRVTLRTTNVVEPSGTITVTSGELTETINITASVIEKPKELLWIKTLDNLGIGAAAARSMDIYSNGTNCTLYFSNKGSGYYTLNPKNVTINTNPTLTPVSVSGISNDFWGHNLRVTDDGQVLIGNSAASSKNILTVSKINNTTAEALTPTATVSGRTDYFNVYGDWEKSGYVLALESGSGRITKIPFSNKSLSTPKYVENAALKTDANISKAYPIDNNSFYSSQVDKLITKNSISTGEVLEEFGTIAPPKVGTTGLAVFSIHNHTYMVAPTNKNGAFEIFDITQGISKATQTGLLGQSIGTNANGYGMEFCTHIEGNDVYLYVFDPTNGLAAYKYEFLPDPILTVSPTAVSLSRVVGSTDIVAKDVKISGTYLRENITITEVSDPQNVFDFTTSSSWDGRTGGTLTIKFASGKPLGTYTGTITVKSGTLTQTIHITAIVEEEKQIDDAVLDYVNVQVSVENLWAEDLGFASTDNRSFAYYDNNLYISNRVSSDANKSGFIVVNASYGTVATSKSTKIASFTMNNLRITSDGQMLFGNTGSGSSTTAAVSVYSSSLTTGGNNYLKDVTMGARSDFFYTYGSWKNDGYLLALAELGNKVVKFPFSNSALGTAEIITNTSLPTGAYSKAVPSPDGDAFYANTATNSIPTKHNFDGKKIESFSASASPTQAGVSGMGVFTILGHTYMVLPTNKFGSFDLWEVTNGLSNAILLKNITTRFTSASTNGGINTVDFAINVVGNDAFIYVLVPKNGVAAYKFTFTPAYDCVFERPGNWSTASNWKNSKIPTSSDHALIKAACTVDGYAQAQSIHLLENNGTLTIHPTAALVVQQTIRRTEDETFPPTTRKAVSAADIVIQASKEGQGVLVYFGESNVPTKATVQLYGANTVDPAQTGTAGYYIPWQYAAMPFEIPKAEETSFAGSWITAWDELKGEWYFKSDNTGANVHLKPWEGYALVQQQIQTYTMAGSLQPNTAQTISLQARVAGTNRGSNFIGNSWTAPLKIAQFENETFTNADKTIYLHKHQNNADAYEAYSVGTTTTQVIDPLQGFFVMCNNTDGGSVTLTYKNLVTNGPQPTQNKWRKPASQPQEETLSAQLTVTADNGYYATVSLFASEQYTTDFDNGYDARKMRDAQAIPYLAAASAAGDMAILASPTLHGVYLNFEQGSGVRYTFTFTYDGEDELLLIDAVTKQETIIRTGNTYAFSPTDDDTYRFRIARKAQMLEGDAIEAWVHRETVYFTNPSGLPTDVRVYSVDGQLVEHTFTQGEQCKLRMPARGVYLIQVDNIQGAYTLKHIL